MPVIRLATDEDIPALLGLLKQVNLVHHLGRPDLFKLATKYGEKELKELLQDNSKPVFVYEEDHTVYGHAFCVLQSVENNRLLEDRKTLYIDDICVDEKMHRKGIASALFQHVQSYARSIGCYNITLNVWTCNPDAMQFYEKMGMLPQKIGMEQIL